MNDKNLDNKEKEEDILIKEVNDKYLDEEDLDIDEDFIKNYSMNSFNKYLLPIALVFTLILIFIILPILYSGGSINIFKLSSNINEEEVVEIIDFFESNYLYKDVFGTDEYIKLKSDLLSKSTIRKIHVDNFISSVANINNDQYTFFTYNKFLDRSYSNIKNRTPNINYENHEEFLLIELKNFEKGTADIIYDIIEGNNNDNLVFDLRGNPGGNLNEAFQIIDIFVPKDIEAFSIIYRDSKKIYLTEEEYDFYFENIFILVDENTASASEVLSLSLKKNLQNTTIIGSETNKKAVGQIRREYSNLGVYFSVLSYKWEVQGLDVYDLNEKLEIKGYDRNMNEKMYFDIVNNKL